MTDTPNDKTPAPDTVDGQTGASFNAAQLVTMACRAVAETTFTAPTPKPDWFDDLNDKLAAAQVLANLWLNDIGPKVTSSIPLQVINFAPTFDAVTAKILKICTDNPDAMGKDDPHVTEVRNLIETVLAPEITQTIASVDETAGALADWGAKITAAHNALADGTATIQAAEIALKGDIDKMNAAISNLHTYIDNENKAIAASAAAIGIGVFALIVGIALAPETGGASLLIGGAIGAAGIIGGSVTWGVMQHKINEQFDEISKDTARLKDDERQVLALQGLQMASNSAVSSLSTAGSALDRLKTQWQVFDGELKGVLKKLDSAEEALSTIAQGVFTEAAQTEWSQAMTTANALANRKLEMQSDTLAPQAAVAA